MPELPEVETIARLIRPDVVGRTIRSARVGWERTLGGRSRRSFARRVRGAVIKGVWRRGKYIVLDLERNGRPAGALVVHLRMSGRLLLAGAAQETPYARVSLVLDNERVFHFIDVRKFGRFVWVEDTGEILDPLGVEPLEEAFSEEWLAERLRARRRLLKPLLLDQSFIAGLGNIYVDEALFASGLHPLSRSDRISRPAARRLWSAITTVLGEAIEREGSSFDTFYRTPQGQPGSYQHQFQVYGRTGRACRHCGTTIRRIVVGQRGTHLCPRCQRRARS